MKSIVRVGEHILGLTALPRLSHQVLFRNSITILTYHALVRTDLKIYDWSFLDELSFRRQMRYLKKHFQMVSLKKAIELRQERTIDRPTAVITFDDGFQNNYDIAFPILQDEAIPATIFLTTGLIGSDSTVWFCRLNQAFMETNKKSFTWNEHPVDLTTIANKTRVYETIKKELKKLPQPQLLAKVDQLVTTLGLDPRKPIDRDSPFAMLNRKSIKAMVLSNIIDFGAHTHTHAILSRLKSKDKFKEIEQSVNNVGELTGNPCELFAYPNGKSMDYGWDCIRLLQKFGVQAAVTTIAGPNRKQTSPFELQRYGIGAKKNMTHFQVRAHHLISLIKSEN